MALLVKNVTRYRKRSLCAPHWSHSSIILPEAISGLNFVHNAARLSEKNFEILPLKMVRQMVKPFIFIFMLLILAPFFKLAMLEIRKDLLVQSFS